MTLSTEPASVIDLSRPQRQSRLAVVFLAIRTVRQIGLIQLVVFVGFAVTRSPSLIAFAAFIVVLGLVLLAIAAIQWWRYTFAVVDGELQVHRGVISQQNLTIPLERVQSVSLEQKLLHRPVALVQVSLDTAGTQTAELTIDAVEKPVAEALQRAAADHRKRPAETPMLDGEIAETPPPPVATDRVVVQHAPSRVVTMALTQMPLAGLVLIAPLFAVGEDLKRFVPFDLSQIGEPTAGWWLLWAVPLFIVAGLLLSIVLNLIRVVLTDWNLTLTATAAGLRRQAGLLSTTSVASSLARIQRITISQGVIERWASLHSVSLDTVGTANFSIPGCDAAQCSDIRSLALADSTGVDELDRKVSPQVVFLRTRNALIASTLLAAALLFLIGWWALITFVRVPIVWLIERRRVRLRRWGFANDAVADRRELAGWSRHEILLHKVNAVQVRQSLFERKRGLASVRFDTASGTISIGMIPHDEATALRDRTLFAVETDRRAWM